MFSIVSYAILIIFAIFSFIKPKYSFVFVLFIVAFGSFFDYYTFEYAKFISLLIILVAMLIDAARNDEINMYIIIFDLIVVMKELVCFAIGISDLNQLIMSIYVYAIIFSICYFGFRSFKRNKVDILNVMKCFFIICFLIQLYRTFFDYTFFGVKPYEFERIGSLADAYDFGGRYFRPSSLESPIVYSVQCGLIFGFILFKEGINRKSIFWLLAIIISIILTKSRTGMLIVIALVLVYSVITKKIIFPLFIVFTGAILLFALGYGNTFMSIFDFSSETYARRITSIQNTISTIKSFNLVDILFGRGYGIAGYIQDDLSVSVYAENFYLALIVNSGFLSFCLFILYSLISIAKGMKSKNRIIWLFIAILMSNYFAISLLCYSIQIFFWFFSFELLNSKREKEKNARFIAKVRSFSNYENTICELR
ncbi:MAG: hypothetical protein J6X93_06420 [Bacilli bacterium]|nr:hypothetical protein [Bacilli bacterium]